MISAASFSEYMYFKVVYRYIIFWICITHTQKEKCGLPVVMSKYRAKECLFGALAEWCV